MNWQQSIYRFEVRDIIPNMHPFLFQSFDIREATRRKRINESDPTKTRQCRSGIERGKEQLGYHRTSFWTNETPSRPRREIPCSTVAVTGKWTETATVCYMIWFIKYQSLILNTQITITTSPITHWKNQPKNLSPVRKIPWNFIPIGKLL